MPDLSRQSLAKEDYESVLTDRPGPPIRKGPAAGKNDSKAPKNQVEPPKTTSRLPTSSSSALILPSRLKSALDPAKQERILAKTNTP